MIAYCGTPTAMAHPSQVVTAVGLGKFLIEESIYILVAKVHEFLVSVCLCLNVP